MVEYKSHKDESQDYIRENEETGEQDLYIDTFIRSILQQYMGTALDLARISPMNDRQLQQYQRKMKDRCYELAENSAKILEKFGYKLGDEHIKRMD